jgi:hypothetical protein
MITMFQGKIQGGGHGDDGMLQLAAKFWWVWEQARTRAKRIQ